MIFTDPQILEHTSNSAALSVSGFLINSTVVHEIYYRPGRVPLICCRRHWNWPSGLLSDCSVHFSDHRSELVLEDTC